MARSNVVAVDSGARLRFRVWAPALESWVRTTGGIPSL
jgi:hypothetical protein